MNPLRFFWLSAVIAAHPNRTVVGRTRLQKTIKLLQRLGMPTDYDYSIHFYGPYSEGLQAEIGIVEQFGLVKEELKTNSEGSPYYVLTASEKAVLPEIKRFQSSINTMADSNPVVLELAATYDAFREQGSEHAEAMKRVRLKKGPKCGAGKLEAALKLLCKLGLPNE
ncbi:MAG TPA: hypothetical protein VKX17_05470 [Planctomycetota bacterium]|nr:hypothetical protein [Planctomycetota bacterium]